MTTTLYTWSAGSSAFWLLVGVGYTGMQFLIVPRIIRHTAVRRQRQAAA